MKSIDAAPAYGHVWTHKKNGREVFVRKVANRCVEFNYFDTGRICVWFQVDFEKKFQFTYVDSQ